ncbi:MAG: alpha/beta hydrolase [Bryobacteraceae bacterium]
MIVRLVGSTVVGVLLLSASLAASSCPAASFVDVPGVRLEYIDWGGAGDPIVLVPGGCQSAMVFDDFARLLTPAHRLLGVTARGCGLSGLAPSGYGIDMQIDDLIGFLDALGIERGAFAGHSSGGGVVIRLARRYPKRVTRLITLDTIYGGVPPEFEPQMETAIRANLDVPPALSLESHRRVFQAWELGAWSGALECEFLRQTERQPDGSLKYRPRLPAWQTAFAGDTEAGRYFETTIRHPALFLVARDLDLARIRQLSTARQRELRPLVGKIIKVRGQQIKAFQRNGRNVRVTWLSNASHYLFVDRMQEVAAQVRQFMQVVDRRP